MFTMMSASVARQAGAAAGFTLVEALVALAVFAILLALGIPSMSNWMLSNKALAAGELYAEGFRLARLQAIGHNAASRVLFTPNAGNGQMDWQVDLCFPTPVVPCGANSGVWSSTAAAAAGDPEGSAGYKSVFRSAGALPQDTVLTPTLLPDGASALYFTPLGWVDTNFAARLTRIQLDPDVAHAASVRSTALVINLAGSVTRCDPAVAIPDSRACPP